MDQERSRRVKELLHAALERESEERQAFLDDACGKDTDLRRQIELLLAKEEDAESFLETPAMRYTSVAQATAERRPGVVLGRQFGPYKIMSPLGAGGMGEVYRAHDSKLGRDVAIKTLPAAFARDSERLARFRREARTLASLNHPNIAAIYGLEESSDLDCLVLELVEGETLHGPLPLAKALDYARQVAEALEAAHEKGIIHRDLKPANVKVTPQGRVKVLDFGLAKALWGTEQDRDASQQAPATGIETQTGHMVGTPGYMSPEQARGKDVDKRTDIWAFGCLLYELLAGKRAFQSETQSDTIAAVLEREPDWQVLPAKTPAKIRELLRRCLQKDAGRRPANIADAREIIEKEQRGWNRWRVVAIAAAALAVLAVGAALWLRSPSRSVDRSQWVQLTNLPDSVTSPALSPDGRMLAFIRGSSSFWGSGQIYVKMLPDGQPVQLTRDGSNKMSPVFSPDGARVAYTTFGGWYEWNTWVVPVLGGEPQLMLRNAAALTWTGPRQVLFSEVKEQVPHMGIVAAQESRIGQRDVYLPTDEYGMAHRSYLSPDGRWVLVVEMDGDHVWAPCRLVPTDGSSAGRKVGPPAAACTFAAWSPDGKWMYFNSSRGGGGNHIWRQRFPDGSLEQVTSGPTEEEGIAMAPDGRSFVTAVTLSNVSIWVHDASGDRPISLEGNSADPKFTLDGRNLYYRIVKQTPNQLRFMGGEPGEVWATDLKSGRSESLAPGFQALNYDISADGRQVVMEAADREGKPQLWVASIDRKSPPRQIPHVQGRTPRFGPGGEIFFLAGGFTYSVRPDGTGLRKALPQQTLLLSRVSPDGRWITAWGPVSGGSATWRAFPLGGGAPVVTGPGAWHWSPDGNLLSISGGRMPRGRSYIVPLPPEQALPKIPAAGLLSEEEVASLPGARRINEIEVVPGTSPDVYAFYRGAAQRNLYRIPIP